MHALAKTACAIHNLSLATAFGGPIFARYALRRAVIREVTDEKERGRILECAWTKYSKLNVPAHLLFTGTWLVERHAIKHFGVDRRTMKLVHVKDLLIAGALVTGISNVIVGKMVKRDYPEGVPITDKPSADARLEKYRRYFRVMGPANLVFVGGSLAIGPFIGGAIIRSVKKNLLTRLFAR